MANQEYGDWIVPAVWGTPLWGYFYWGIDANSGIMPNLVGLLLDEATFLLEYVGIINQSLLGYFGTWPITVEWENSTEPELTVLAQTPAAGTQPAVNSAIVLTVSQPIISIAYP